MNVTIELMNASSESNVPSPRDFRRWAEAVLQELAWDRGTLELSIKLVGEKESAFLNESFRQKKGPTNVLSFPYPATRVAGVNLLGDLAICAPLVRKEAEQQDKQPEAHWAHLTVHGVLHLCGYDHDEPRAAAAMENLETGILNTLGYENPYH